MKWWAGTAAGLALGFVLGFMCHQLVQTPTAPRCPDAPDRSRIQKLETILMNHVKEHAAQPADLTELTAAIRGISTAHDQHFTQLTEAVHSVASASMRPVCPPPVVDQTTSGGGWTKGPYVRYKNRENCRHEGKFPIYLEEAAIVSPVRAAVYCCLSTHMQPTNLPVPPVCNH